MVVAFKKGGNMLQRLGSDLVKTKLGTLTRHLDILEGKLISIGKVMSAEDVGITMYNTPTANTAALEAVRAEGGVALEFGEGTYPFDVFRTRGLLGVSGKGKTKTIITLQGNASPVSVQPSNIVIEGIHFKSVAGIKKWQRIGMVDGATLRHCKVSNFTDDPSRPNAWGVYFKNAKGCRLYDVEFENNTQSDIAILEGTTDLIIEGCYHTTGNLVVNFEPNVGNPEQNGIIFMNSQINKLYLLCNDSSTKPDNVATFIGCTINDLQYDGLGASFVRCKINGYTNQSDARSRMFGSTLHGIDVSPVEMLEDPMFSCVGGTGSGASWELNYSSTSPANRYNRKQTGEITLSLNVASSTSLKSKELPCEAGSAYLITIEKYLDINAGRPDIISIRFYKEGGEEAGMFFLNRYSSSTLDRQQHIIVAPVDATKMRLVVGGGDTTTVLQTVSYRFASIRKVTSLGVDASSITSSFPSRVKLPVTYDNFLSNQLYFAPLPVGTEVEFKYEAGKTRLAVVMVQGADCTSRIGTLQPIASYP